MSDTESLDYLQSGFDANSLTVPRLRSILVQHNIPYPASAKKPQLVEIFTDNVLPQSRKILNARARARRTSKGITNADQGEETPVKSDEDKMPPPPTPRSRQSSRSGRKASGRLKVEDSESEGSSIRSPTKRTPRASSKHARASDTEGASGGDSTRKVSRKSRKSETPSVKAEDLDDGLPKPRARDNVFTDDNPFQSGSSPPPSRTPSVAKRRTLGSSVGKDPTRRKSSSSTPRRRTAEVTPQTDGITPPTSATFEIPVSKLNGLKSYDGNGVEAGEDFTPEAQLELVRERSANGINAVGPRRPKPRTARRMNATTPIWVVLLTLLSGYATWYRQEKIAVGYCGVGRPAHQLIPSNVELPDWMSQVVEPQCEPCPQHAYCYPNMETRCEPDFVLKPHPLSLGGVVPFPPTCEPDGEKVRRIQVVADRAIEELRERRAKWECGELKDESGAPATAVEIDEEELKQEVSKKRRKGMSEAEFEDLWGGAIGEIRGREEVEAVEEKADNSRTIRRLTSTSTAKIPLSCAIRRSIRLAVAKHKLQIATLGLIAALILYARHRYFVYTATVAAVPHLVSLTLERLSSQATLHAQDKDAFPERWISISQLRDDVLRNEHSISKRNALWSRVRNVVEMNANVRSSQREDRNGEISRVWEWIGAVGAVEGSGHERRRKSGRVSWGEYGEGSSPVSGTDAGPEVVQQKWQEGRPIY